MGNVQDAPPKNYSTAEVHEGEYMATYKGGGTGGSIPIPNSNARVSLGATILQDIDSKVGEYYVMSRGSRVYLSKKGQFLPTASNLLSRADNFQKGPTLMVTGTPAKPTYVVWGATSTAQSNDWQAMRINSLPDLQKALYVGHPNTQPGKYAANYGDLAVNPFSDHRPRNTFSDLADFGRGIESVATQIALPIIDYGLDEISGGVVGTVLALSGAQDVLQDELDKLTADHGLDYESSMKFTSSTMANFVPDPRLGGYYNKMISASRSRVNKFPKNQYSSQLRTIQNQTHSSPQQKLLAAGRLENLNLEFDSSQQISMLSDAVKILKQKVPNPPNFDWSTVDSGLGAARTPQQSIRIVRYLTGLLSKDVLPFMPKPLVKPPPDPKSIKVSPKTPEDTTQNPANVNKSSTINGDPHKSQKKDTIPPHPLPNDR